MRFIVDECTGPAVAEWLTENGHDTFSVYDCARGSSDDAVLTRAVAENRVLITNDKDFGEKIHREQRLHCGVIFLRLRDERAVSKITALERFLAHHAERMQDGEFAVVMEKRVRFAKNPNSQTNRGKNS